MTSLVIQEERYLAEICLSGTEAPSMAAAKIFVANLNKSHFRKLCENALVQLFNDSTQEVRFQESRCFLYFEREKLGNYISLVEAFVNSPAFTTDFE